MNQTEIKTNDYMWWILAAVGGPVVLLLFAAISFFVPTPTILGRILYGIPFASVILFVAILGYIKPERSWRWASASLLSILIGSLFPFIFFLASSSTPFSPVHIEYVAQWSGILLITFLLSLAGAYAGSYLKKRKTKYQNLQNLDKARYKKGIAPIIIALIVALLAGGGYAVVKTNPGIAKKLGIEKQVEKVEAIITVLSPNGGEKLIIGQTYPVTWSLLNKSNLVRMVLVPGDIPVTSFGNAATEFFSPFSWTIPSNTATGSYKIEARLYSDSGSVPHQIASDVSDSYFTITASAMADETANWKTYTNEQLGFEFKYPQDLFSPPQLTTSKGRIISDINDLNDKPNDRESLSSLKLCYLSADKYCSKKEGEILEYGLHINFNTENSGYKTYQGSVPFYSQNADYSKVTIGGAIVFKRNNGPRNEISLIKLKQPYFISTLSMSAYRDTCLVSRVECGLIEVEDSKTKILYEQILSTFKFTK